MMFQIRDTVVSGKKKNSMLTTSFVLISAGPFTLFRNISFDVVHSRSVLDTLNLAEVSNAVSHSVFNSLKKRSRSQP